MSVTHRSDAPLLAGYHHSGDRGMGVLAESIPATGEHGPAIGYPGLSLPADIGKEIMVSILTVPASLTLFQVDELGRVTAEGTTGVGTYRLWADGVDRGTSTYTVQIGGGVVSGDAALGDVGAGGGAGGGTPSGISGGAALGDVAATGGAGGGAPSGISGGAQLEDVQAGGGASANSGLASGNAQLGDVAAGGGATSTPSGTASGNATLDDVQASGGASSQPSGTAGGNATLDDVAAAGGASVPSGSLGGSATLEDAQAGGGAASLPSGSAGGNATLDDVAAAGGASTPSGSAGGGAQLDDAQAGGQAGGGLPSVASGDLLGQDVGVAGVVQGFEEPVAVIGKRFVEVGFARTPKHLEPLDVAEVDDIAFRFGKMVRQGETLQGFTSTCQRRVGVDPAADPLRVGGPQKFGTDAVQRVDGSLGVVGVTYLIRVVATMNNGRTEVGTAFIKVVRRS